MQSLTDYERYYMRPHRTCGQYPDVHQYTPVINGIAGWQLYNGNGFTSFSEIPTGEWVHLRIEVHGTQARVFLGDMENPVLEVDELVHGRSRGSIGVNGPRDGSAHFSNFSWRADDDLVFESPPVSFPPPGVIGEWKLAGPYSLSELDLNQALLQYENTVLEAFREVEDALIGVQTYREQMETVERKLKAARNAARLSAERYDKGVTSYLEVLDTERTLFSVELELSELKQTYLNTYVRLYKSLGGGWTSVVEEDVSE